MNNKKNINNSLITKLYKPQYKLNKYHDSLCSKLVMLKGDEDIYRKVFSYKNYFFHNKNNENLSNSIIFEKNLELKNIFKKFEHNIINKNCNTFYSKMKNFLNIKNIRVNERQNINPIRLKKNISTINIKNINKKENNLIFNNFYNEKSLFDSNNGIIFNKNRFNTYNKRLKFITKNFMEIPIIEKVIKNDKKIFNNKKNKNININKFINNRISNKNLFSKSKMRNNSENNLINKKIFKFPFDNNYIKNKRKFNRINNLSLLNTIHNNNLFTNSLISKNKKYNSLDNLNFNLIKFNFIRNNKIIKKFNFHTSFSSNDILNKNNNKKIKN